MVNRSLQAVFIGRQGAHWSKRSLQRRTVSALAGAAEAGLHREAVAVLRQCRVEMAQPALLAVRPAVEARVRDEGSAQARVQALEALVQPGRNRVGQGPDRTGG